MDQENIAKVWVDYIKSPTPATRDILLENYLELVKIVVGRVGASLPSHIDRKDLISIGIIGLVDAISKFDPSKETKFETYASTRIRGQIIDHLRSMDWVPRSIRSKINVLEKCYEEHLVNTGTRADQKTICEKLNMTSREYTKLMGYYTSLTLLSLNQHVDSGAEADKRVELGDIIKDHNSPSPRLKAQYHEVRNILTKAIGELSKQERLAVVLYYYQELMLKEIGVVLKVSESRVSQILAGAMIHLRIKLKKFKDILINTDI